MKKFTTISENDARNINGGVAATTMLAVAGGVCGAIGFINLGIDIGNWLFKNNCRHLFSN